MKLIIYSFVLSAIFEFYYFSCQSDNIYIFNSWCGANDEITQHTNTNTFPGDFILSTENKTKNNINSENNNTVNHMNADYAEGRRARFLNCIRITEEVEMQFNTTRVCVWCAHMINIR